MAKKGFFRKPRKNKKSKKPKNLSLESSMADNTMQVFKNDNFICIQDKYPKSDTHLLLIPVRQKLTNLEELIRLPESLSFLKEMKKCSKFIVDSLPNSIDKSNLQYGFHAIQTFEPLHMHIISRDFSTEFLKNDKIWNSFNTDYFIDLDDLIEHLEKDLDYLSKDYFIADKFHLRNHEYLNKLLQTRLKCNICNSIQFNLNNLKEHLLSHH